MKQSLWALFAACLCLLIPGISEGEENNVAGGNATGDTDTVDCSTADGDEDAMYFGEPDSSDTSALSAEIREKMIHIIKYGPGTGEEEFIQSTPVAPYVPVKFSSGEIRVKMKKGHTLEKSNSVTSIRQDGAYSESEMLMYLDYEFQELTIRPLWGDSGRLSRLRKQGEANTGRSLPDLSLWYSVKAVPTHPEKRIIRQEDFGNPRLTDDEAQEMERAIEILHEIPGVELVYAAAPLTLASWPDAYHEDYSIYGYDPFAPWRDPWGDYDEEYEWGETSTWTHFQTSTGPDLYNSSGDYDNMTLNAEDLSSPEFPYNQISLYLYWINPLYFSDLICTDGSCYTGGLNVWPAWDLNYKGSGVSIGYIEEDWCLSPADEDEEYDVLCPTHPDLMEFHENQLKYLTPNRPDGPMQFGPAHGTPVLGIMAADHNIGDQAGTMGISPEADYYIGQAWNTEEWIDIAEKLVTSGNGKGAIFLLEPPSWCFVQEHPWDIVGSCPLERYPEYFDFIRVLTANDIVVINIPGNDIGDMDNPAYGYWTGDRNYEPGGDEDYPWDSEWEFAEPDTTLTEPDAEFEYPDSEIIDWPESTIYPNSYKTLRRSSSSFVDTGAIVVTAGLSQDVQSEGLYFLRRSRNTWAPYGSRADIQGRDTLNVSTTYSGDFTYNNEIMQIYGYGPFMGTSSCGPQATGVAALTQQMYKDVRGDHLTSIRMRNALVENGNPQITHSEDPSRTINNFGAPPKLPEELESPQEPFARIGPRPDVGRILQAFNIIPENGASETASSIRVTFSDHQYGEVNFAFMGALQFYSPNEPFGLNWLGHLITAEDTWQVNHMRSPRIDGGHAVKVWGHFRASNHFLLMADDGIDGSAMYLHPTDGINFTLSGWVNVQEMYGDYHTIIAKDQPSPWRREYGLYISPYRKVHFHCFSKRDSVTQISTFSTDTIDLNRMHHVAAVFSEGSTNNLIKFYIDGQDAGTVTTSEPGCMQVNDLVAIGNGLRGYLDEARYEARVVSQSELQARYETGANPPGLIGDWRFDRKNVWTIYDPVHQYDGSLTTNALSDFYSEWGPGRPIGSFSGDDYVTISDPNDQTHPPADLRNLGNQFSIEAHFRSPTTTALRDLVTRHGSDWNGNSWKVYWSNNKIYFRVCTTLTSCYVANTTTLTQDRWYHVVASYNYKMGTSTFYYTMKIFVDGEDLTETAPTTNGAAAYDSAQPIVIGSISGVSANRWDSPIDFVRVYKKALRIDGIYGDANWVNTNRNDIKWLFDHRASMWQNSYYGDYPGNRYADE